MEKFDFVIRDEENNLKKGSIEAVDAENAADILSDKGYIIVDIMETKETSFSKRFKKIKIPRKEMMLFYLQLSTLINTGVTLIEAIEVLGNQSKNLNMKKMLNNCQDEIMGGKSFSEALENYPTVFSKLYVNLIKAGETGGMLSDILDRIAKFAEADQKIKSKVRGAMAYPVLMILISAGVVFFLLSFVFPKFKKMFEKMGTALPLPTQMLIVASNFLVDHLMMFLFGIASIVGGSIYFFGHTTIGKHILHRVRIKIPLLGNLVLKATVARFTRTLGTLIKSGVPIITALEIVRETIDDTILYAIVNNTIDEVSAGENVSTVLERANYFPPMVTKMIQVGERTGVMADMLVKVGIFYETEVEMAIESMLSLMEPLMICMMGAVIGFIAISMFLPMFDMTKMIKG